MSKYEIIRNEGKTMIQDTETKQYFAGYDFMGSVEWRDEIDADCILAQYEDADQIVKDLEAADEIDKPKIRENVGYEIIRSLRIDDHHEIVIGKHPTAPASYVCWDCTNGDDYNNGGYCMSFRQALAVMAERITSRYDFLPVEA